MCKNDVPIRQGKPTEHMLQLLHFYTMSSLLVIFFSPKTTTLINVLKKNLNQRSIDQRFTSLVKEKYYIGNIMLLQLCERAGDGHPKAEICPGFGEEGAR